MKPGLIAVILILLAPAPGAANPVIVRDAWARLSTGPISYAAVYLTVVNTSTTATALVTLSSPISRTAELRQVNAGNHVAPQMRIVRQVPVPEQSVQQLRPDGYYAILTDLQHRLRPGALFPITVTFENGEKQKVLVTVR